MILLELPTGWTEQIGDPIILSIALAIISAQFTLAGHLDWHYFHLFLLAVMVESRHVALRPQYSHVLLHGGIVLMWDPLYVVFAQVEPS